MLLKLKFFLLLCLLSLTFWACKKEASVSDQESQEDAQQVLAPPLKPSSVLPKSDKLPYEIISTGIDEETFKKKVATLLSLDLQQAIERLHCGQQEQLDFYSIEKGKILQKAPVNQLLSFCVLYSQNLEISSPVLSVRGVFAQNSLVQLEFGFLENHLDLLTEQFSKRFGQGEKRQLLKENLMGKEQHSALLWQTKNNLYSIWQSKMTMLTIWELESILDFKEVLSNSNEEKKKLKELNLEGSPYLDLDKLLPEELLSKE
jgi:hypothetical protein